MRGKPGPLRFIVEGRRIYVNLESLEAFLSPQAPSDSPKALTAEKALPERIAARNADLERENQVPIVRESQQEQVKTVGRSGQRELILPRRQVPLVILYMA